MKKVCEIPGCKTPIDTREARGRRNLNTRVWRQKQWQNGDCLCCGKRKENPGKQLCNVCNKKKLQQTVKRGLALKAAILDAYGSACKCCGEKEPLFLSLDHINNDGYKEQYSGYHLYSKLRRLGFPSGFQILCHNCNLGRHLNKGVCPHVTMR